MVTGQMRLTELFHRPVPLEVARTAIAPPAWLGCVAEDITRRTGVKFAYCDDDYAEALRHGPSSKLLVYCRPGELDAACRTLGEALGDEAALMRGSPTPFVEVLRKDVCNGNELELLCGKLNVGLEECM